MITVLQTDQERTASLLCGALAMEDRSERPAETSPLPPCGRGAIPQQGELLQTVLDSLTHPFYVVDVTNYEIRLANRAARQMHKTGAATCYALAHARDLPCDTKDQPCPLKIITETRQPAVVEHIHYDEQGRRKDVQVHGFPILDKNGRVVQVIEYCVDVTEHKRMVEKHQWELAVNKAIAELADALIDSSFSIEEIADIVLERARRLTGSEHGYVSSIDPETGDMTSHTLTRMMGQQCRVPVGGQDVVFHPGPDGKFPALFGHALNTGRGFYTDAPSRHPASTGLPEGHIPLKNFLTVPALVADQVVGQIALANSDRGYSDRDLEAIDRMAKLYALAIQRRRAETALRNSEERYALAQTAGNIGSWDWNIVTGKLIWSERIEPMFGFAKGRFGGTYEAFLESVHPDDRQFVMDSVDACVEQNQGYRIAHRIVWPDGTVRWVSETGDVVRDPGGKAVRMLGVVQDITERKQAEREIRKLNEELEQRVRERTAELTEANAQLRDGIERRRRLEKEILEISEREQRRIGQELHDSLGQQLTGIAIISKVLEQKLERQSVNEASDAREIAQLVNEAVSQTRQLSRGLHPVALDENGLMSALKALAGTTQNVFGVACVFKCNKPVLVKDTSVATHLYRIAQEAVTNAVRHGEATQITLKLAARPGRTVLTVDNDGRDFPTKLPRNKGMGLQVMSYRAEMIGGTLDVRQRPGGGTRVTCVFD